MFKRPEKKTSPLMIYGSVVAILISWWWLAFGGHTNPPASSFNETPLAPSSLYQSSLSNLPITYMDRKELKETLAGNLSNIPSLITNWDVDAELMQNAGITNISRIDPQNIIKAHTLSRLIENGKYLKINISFVKDDTGKTITLDKTFTKFLPQTYVAASFLLALVPLEQIIALPRNLRADTDLYPKKMTRQIPLDIDRYNGEKLYRLNPDIAFIAHYSNPTTIQALKDQKIELYTMKNPDSIQDILHELKTIGQITNKSLEAELLALFIESAMVAIDNRLAFLSAEHEAINSHPPTILFLNFHHTFSIPTTKTLNGQLIARLKNRVHSLKFGASINDGHEWVIPISKEEIVNLNPECLIVITENKSLIESEVIKDQALNQVTAVKNKRICFLKESIQHSPSQYIVLAYYDLAETLINLP